MTVFLRKLCNWSRLAVEFTESAQLTVLLAILQSFSNGNRVDQPLRQQSKSLGARTNPHTVIGLLNLLFLQRDNLEIGPDYVYGQIR